MFLVVPDELPTMRVFSAMVFVATLPVIPLQREQSDGYSSIEEIAETSVEELQKIEGFDEDIATEIKNRAVEYLEDDDEENEEDEEEIEEDSNENIEE